MKRRRDRFVQTQTWIGMDFARLVPLGMTIVRNALLMTPAWSSGTHTSMFTSRPTGHRSRQMPVALATDRCQDCRSLVRAQRKKITHLRARLSPLFPVAHSHASAQPLIQRWDRSVVLGDADLVSLGRLLTRYRIAVDLGCALLVALGLQPSTGAAQPYPSKPIRIIVGVPAGAGPDVEVRLLAPR